MLEFRKSQLWEICVKHWPMVLIIVLSLIGQTVMTLLMPWPMKNIIDHIIREVPTAGVVTGNEQGLVHFIFQSAKTFITGTEYDFLYKETGLLCLIVFMNSLFLYIQSRYVAKMGQTITLEVRDKLFTHLINLPQHFFDNAKSGDLTNRISKDTAELHDIFESLVVIAVKHIPTILGILIIVFTLDTIYALTFVIVIPLIYLATSYFIKRTKASMRHQRRIEGNMASTAQEAIYCHKAVVSHSMEANVTEELIADGKLSAECGEQSGRFQGLLASSVEFIVSITTAMVLFVGALRILHGCLTVGQLTVFLAYLKSLFNPIKQFSKFMGRIAKSMASNERIEEILKISASSMGVSQAKNAVTAPHFKGHIRFENIVFGYKTSHKVVNGFSLEVQPGQKVALVGESGCGKSTIVQFLLRLYDPEKGVVRIDGYDIKTLILKSLRSQIATVLQDSFIFDGTIKSNIALGRPDVADEMIIAAAKAARADDFITRLPQGYNTAIGEGGTNLSGGQRRRITIARAILCDAPIVILDEPTTGLDAASEKKVMEALDLLSQKKTTLIVTHQLSTISNADRIVVIENGRIVEEGTHHQLMADRGLYYHLWQNQQEAQKSKPENACQ